MTDETILWQRRDQPGHELVRLTAVDSGWTLTGFALFAHEGLPCRLAYSIRCDEGWRTISAHVSGRVGARQVGLVVAADRSRQWTLNNAPAPEATGCVDVDLNFSPSTNLLPIARLNLGVGESAEVRAAWLRFPSFALEPLVQTYTRTGERKYRYQSANGFEAELEVSANGLPLTYGDLWSTEARC